MSKTQNAAKTTRKPRTPSAHADETKAQRFVRLAEARVSKTLKMIDNIGKLGGSNYERTPEQVNAIAAALHNGIEEALEKLDNQNKPISKAFKLA